MILLAGTLTANVLESVSPDYFQPTIRRYVERLAGWGDGRRDPTHCDLRVGAIIEGTNKTVCNLGRGNEAGFDTFTILADSRDGTWVRYNLINLETI